MSWTGLFPAGPGAPGTLTLRETVLAALAIAALDCRDTGHCDDCAPGRLCPDHAELAAYAVQYEAAYMRIRGIGSDGAVLELTGGLS